MKIITDRYNRESWKALLIKLLHDDFVPSENNISLGFESKLLDNRVVKLGSSDTLELTVFEVKQKKGDAPRVSITRDLFKLVRNYTIENALIFIISEESENYRLSLITRELELHGKRVKEEFSNPRRYSYQLGPGVKKHTIEKYLFKTKGMSEETLFFQPKKIVDIEDLKSRFSIEVVNKDFYNGLSELFSKLVGGKRGKTEFQGLLKLPGTDHDQAKREFAIRLIGRVVFCWFLKKKESANGDPLIPESILSSESVTNNSDYYHKVLEPLFFEVMNKKHEDREPDIKANRSFENIPFLNGGLFDYSAHNDYYKPYGEDSEQRYSFNLIILDEWFIELFKLFELYNFTIDENTPVDIDISVDPEMLGRIFENLLAKINPETEDTARKSSGSFYTPREIVEYMVDESLLEHILSKFGDRDKYEPKLRKLLDYSEDDGYDFTPAEKRIINDSLDDLKILDPACGSGAFPMGILQKMFLIRQKLAPDLRSWIDKQLRGIKNPVLRKDAEKKYEYENSSYLYKVFAILKSIYGVDIQPLAVEISKLRFFLTLIVDQMIDDSKPNRGVSSLPNLAFKFIAANSLIRLKESRNGYEIREAVVQDWTYLNSESHFDGLNVLREEYFATDSIEEKVKISEEFKKRQKLLANEIIDNQLTDTNIIKITNWNPFSDEPTDWFEPKWMFGIENGFDIVIGNPPYIQLQSNGGLLARKYEDEDYQTFARTGDIYCLFYERGLSLAKKNGLLCYITSNKWMRTDYGRKLRNYLSYYNPLLLIDLGGNVFKEATVDTNIILIRNKYKQGHSFKALDISNEKEKKHFNLYNNWATITDISEDTWKILPGLAHSILNKIEKYGKPLHKWDIAINCGIKTGYNEAFIIDSDAKDEILNKCTDTAERDRTEKLIRPVLRGRDIKRYSIDWQDLWLIGTFPSLKLNIDNYPSLKLYLKSFGKRLDQTGAKGSRKKTSNKWFETQDAIKYHSLFINEKIVWGNIESYSSFALSTDHVYINAPANLLTSDKVNLMFLLSVLNSKLFYWEFSNVGIDLGSAFGWKKQYVEQIHIPNPGNRENDLIDLVKEIHKFKSKKLDTNQLEAQIDQIVYELYHLTDEEIDYIEEATKRKKDEEK